MSRKSRVKPHLPVTDPAVPQDPNDKGEHDYCRRCGLAIVAGDLRHTLPPAPDDDVRLRAAGQSGGEG